MSAYERAQSRRADDAVAKSLCLDSSPNLAHRPHNVTKQVSPVTEIRYVGDTDGWDTHSLSTGAHAPSLTRLAFSIHPPGPRALPTL